MRRPPPAVVGPLALLVLAACGADPGTSGGSAATVHAVRADVHVSPLGVGVGIEVGFREDRVLTGAELHVGTERYDGWLQPLDGADSDRPPPDLLPVAAGVRVLVEAITTGGCAGGDAVPVLVVTSTAAGEERTDRYPLADTRDLRTAFAEWCAGGVQLSVTGATSRPGGRYEVVLQLVNPGPHDVPVVSRAVVRDEGRWERAATTAPAGASTELVVRGTGPSGCRAAPPWETGDLLAGGDPLRPATGADGWC